MDAMVWKRDRLELIDQRKLPFEEAWFTCRSVEDIFEAIRKMVVRGAPAIGVTAAYGLTLAVQNDVNSFNSACSYLMKSRPTAVNLRDAIDFMKRELKNNINADAAENAAKAYHQEDLRKNRQIGRFGADFLPGNRRILTHCNTGSLATSGWGTALGIIRQLNLDGRLIEVIADETRPFLQGARLTLWECMKDDLPVKMCTDGMGAHLMKLGKVDAVITGADRIASNGDSANKIGTCMLAIAAKHYGIPFIIAAPTTTVDTSCPTGLEIPIEERPAEEVTHVRGQSIVSEGVEVYNPAFDVTPADLITAIITEEGVFQAPYSFR